MRHRRSSSVRGRSARSSAADGRSAQPLDPKEFAALLAPLGPFEPAPLLACAVSGGADSLALLLLALEWARAREGEVLALTVDHGLRPEAAEEARYVGRVASQLGARHRTLVWHAGRPGVLQAEARAARLRLLTKACRQEGCLHLLLAHHHDDQLETLLLRLSRRSDLDGLAAMAPQRRFAGTRLLRPLLNIPKRRLEATLAAAGLTWIEDPSNRDLRHERVKLRAFLSRPEAPRRELHETAAVLGRLRSWSEQALADWMGGGLAFCPGGYALMDRQVMELAPEPLALRVLSRVLQAVGGKDYPPRGRSLLRLRALLRAPEPKASTLGGCRLLPHGPRWLVIREWRTTASLPIRPGQYGVWDRRFSVSLSAEACEKWDPGGFSVAALGEADRQGLSRETKVDKVPGPARAALPALRYLEAVVAVPHLRQYQRGFQRALQVAAVTSAPAATKLDFTSLARVGILPLETEGRP